MTSMFEQIRALLVAKGENLSGKDREVIEKYIQLFNEQVYQMNNAWYDLDEAEAESDDVEEQQKRREVFSQSLAKLLCAVAALGYVHGLRVEEAVSEVIGRPGVLSSPFLVE